MTVLRNQHRPKVAVIGGGPAGLMAAEMISLRGEQVWVFDAKPSVGRKFLIAGKGGLNLTHSERFEDFLSRYIELSPILEAALKGFTPAHLREWALQLGSDTFVGSSGRVFPQEMQAAPLLRRWLLRLKESGVVFYNRHRWIGWDENNSLLFETQKTVRRIAVQAIVLALGGASWPQTGSTGAWVPILAEKGVSIRPLQPANCGFEVGWSKFFKSKFAGAAMKSVRLNFQDSSGKSFDRRGEFVVTDYGVEGSLVYAASNLIREEINSQGVAQCFIDLAPDRTLDVLESRLMRPIGSRSVSSHLRRQAGLKGVKASLLREVLTDSDLRDPIVLAKTIKAFPLRLIKPRPIEEAISTAGGVAFEELDDNYMLKKLPGVFCAGEMLDWEAPTGGYLLTASMATGRAAGEGVVSWFGE